MNVYPQRGGGGIQFRHLCSYKYPVLGEHSMEAVMVANGNPTLPCGMCVQGYSMTEVPHSRNKCPKFSIL